MKKEVILSILVLILILPFALAQSNETSSGDMKSGASSCIRDKITQDGCSNFGLDDKIFSLLSVKQCKGDLLADENDAGCFGLKSCTLTKTAQATLALSESGSDVTSEVDWILSRNQTVPGIEWLLQVETNGKSTCSIAGPDNKDYTLNIGDDKKLSLNNPSSCLSLDDTGYWLKIKEPCQKQEFEISCDQDFFTSTLFKKENSQVISVLSESPETASAGGTTLAKSGEALCFKKGSKGNFCDYEGTLWSAVVLENMGYDVSSYLPYLISFQEENEKFLPESFLYQLTGENDYIAQLALKQKANRYWDEAYDRYYDSAVALLSMPSTSTERDNAMNWLAESQGGDGCWDSGNVAKTGFLLYSLWPTSTGGDLGDSEIVDCVSSGNYCISDIECSDALGDTLEGDCPAFQVCCSVDKLSETCSDMGGEICNDATQSCNGGYEDSTASDLLSGETCCVLGSCQESTPPQENTCSQNSGNCRVGDCLNGEVQDYSSSCDFSDETCCIVKTKSGGSLWWIWLLLVLIVLTVLAIVFRDKLKDFYMKYKSKGLGGKPSAPSKRRPGISPRGMPPRRPPRRILPLARKTTAVSPPAKRPINPPRGKPNEIDDVLKKLKEMGK